MASDASQAPYIWVKATSTGSAPIRTPDSSAVIASSSSRLRLTSAAARFSRIRCASADLGITMLPTPRCQRHALDASLTQLQTDYIDVYQFHHIDRDTSWDEIWQAIEVAVQQGKILYSGSSNFAGWHIAQAQAAASSRRRLRPTPMTSMTRRAPLSRSNGHRSPRCWLRPEQGSTR